MIRRRILRPIGSLALGLAATGAGCSDGSRTSLTHPSEHVGTPCVPIAEDQSRERGFSVSETYMEERNPLCDDDLCIAVHFQGRVSCPYGQPEGPGSSDLDPDWPEPCYLPGTNERVEQPVAPQLLDRPPEERVYCSCQCDGPPEAAPFCACPAGMECAPIGVSGTALREFDLLFMGSFCAKPGWDDAGRSWDLGETCDLEKRNCDDRWPMSAPP